MNYIELKKGWYIRTWPGITKGELLRYRFDPVTMMMVAGGGMMVGGQVMGGLSAKAEGEAANAIAKYNANLKIQEAAEIQRQASEEAIDVQEAGQELMASQRASYLASGVNLQGTPMTVLNKTAYEIEKERLNILRQGQIGANYATSEANILRLQGKLAKKKGKTAFYSSLLSAGGTVLMAGSQLGFGGGGEKPPASFVPSGGAKKYYGSTSTSGTRNIWHGFTGQKKYG
jgi:hypothetical protein